VLLLEIPATRQYQKNIGNSYKQRYVMAQLHWTSNLNTGIAVIDKQHKMIVEYINQLDDTSTSGDIRDRVAKVIDNLVGYTISHFEFEESMQEEAGYPFLKMHKKLHERFVKRISEFHERFKLGEDITDELHKLMFSWLYVHINSEDMDYVPSILSSLSQREDYVEKEKGIFGSLFS
jgi:hemerythrin